MRAGTWTLPCPSLNPSPIRGRCARAAARQHVLEAAQRAVEEEAACDSDGSQEAAGGDAAAGPALRGRRAGGPLPGEPAGACARVTVLDGCAEARARACGLSAVRDLSALGPKR